MRRWTNTREARLKTWTLRGFEVQDNPPVSGSFLSLAGASKKQSPGSLPAICREPGSSRTTFQESSSNGADLLGPNNQRLQSTGRQGRRLDSLVLDRLPRRVRRPDLPPLA